MTKRNPILTADWLRQRHHVEGARIGVLAREAGCTEETVRRTFDRLGISRRDERAGRDLSAVRVRLDMSAVSRMYVEDQMSCDDIGKIQGCHGTVIRRRLREVGIAIRHHNDTKRGRPSRNRVDLDHADVVSRYMAHGATLDSVGAQFGVSGQVIARVLSEAGAATKPPQPGRYAGEKNPNWRPDLTSEDREKRRDTFKQAQWRARVYERDGYTCQCCADARGGNLHAHHIEPHARNAAVRWDIENGITLCAPCHRGFHRAYGLKRVNREKLDAYISAQREISAAA